jgi:hypothetical protein
MYTVLLPPGVNPIAVNKTDQIVMYKQQKGSTDHLSQLNFHQFHCLLRVLAFGKAVIRKLKIQGETESKYNS